MRVQFTLTGTMPLLMHADDIEAADTLREWRQAPENKNLSVPGDDRSPAWTWQTYLYSDGEHIVIPQECIMVCLRQAGAQMILKRQKTFKEISQSGLLMDTEYCEFKADGKLVEMSAISKIRDLMFKQQMDAVVPLGFRLWPKRAKIGQQKHIRVRPRFEKWQVQGTMEVLAPEITFEHLQTMFGLAGRVGLSDWRPGCKTPGPYGMFSAKLKKVV